VLGLHQHRAVGRGGSQAVDAGEDGQGAGQREGEGDGVVAGLAAEAGGHGGSFRGLRRGSMAALCPGAAPAGTCLRRNAGSAA
jgi:hypothetical protein